MMKIVCDQVSVNRNGRHYLPVTADDDPFVGLERRVRRSNCSILW